MRVSAVLLLAVLIAVSGCATPVYRDVFKEKESYNSREYTVPVDILSQAVTRVICSRNFIIEQESADKGFMVAKRSFQQGKKTVVLVLQVKMDSLSTDRTMLYLTALQTTETYYVSDHTRFFLFLIPLPGGGGKNASQIKEGEKVIDDKSFYKDFFDAIQKEVVIVSAGVAKEKSIEITEPAAKTQAVPVPQVQESAPQGTGAVLQNAPGEEKKESLSAESNK
jgi:hypothetical protein